MHLHSTYATALSCLSDVDPEDAIPPMTPYVVMRVGRVPVVPYTRPGSLDVAPLIWAKAAAHGGILLGNHGPVVAGTSLEAAVFAIEELEEAAKLLFITSGFNIRYLEVAEIADLEATFKPSLMARFSANLGFLWPDRPLLARIDAAAGAGFRAIEVHWPYDVPAAASEGGVRPTRPDACSG